MRQGEQGLLRMKIVCVQQGELHCSAVEQKIARFLLLSAMDALLLYMGGGMAGIGTGATLELAMQDARSKCPGNCEHRYAHCNNPVRIR